MGQFVKALVFFPMMKRVLGLRVVFLTEVALMVTQPQSGFHLALLISLCDYVNCLRLESEAVVFLHEFTVSERAL